MKRTQLGRADQLDSEINRFRLVVDGDRYKRVLKRNYQRFRESEVLDVILLTWWEIVKKYLFWHLEQKGYELNLQLLRGMHLELIY